MKTEQFLEHLEHVRKSGQGWMARCPAHDDGKASLSINEAEDRILVKCQAGCATQAVMQAMNLGMSDLFFEGQRKTADLGDPEAVYVYENSSGAPVIEVHRFPGKEFRQKLAGAEDWGLKGLADKPLFRLPQVLEAVREGRRIWIVEGEKDVLAIERQGGVATCCIGGAGKWNHNYVHPLRGAKHVRIVADKDEVGLAHAQEVSKSLGEIPHDIVQSRHGKDAFDHFAGGGTLKNFEAAPEIYEGIMLVAVSEIPAKETMWLPDWEGFFPYGGLSHLAGLPDMNKSTLTCMLAAEVSQRGDTVIMVNSEDSIAGAIRPRLVASGANMDLVLVTAGSHVSFPSSTGGIEMFIQKHRAKLMIIDPIDAHLDGSVDSYKNQSIRSALAPLARIADQTGCAIVLVGHPTKSREKDPMMRIGGSIGIPGISRSAMIMGCPPEVNKDSGMRVLAVYKHNWTSRPRSKLFQVELGPGGEGVRLSRRGETPLVASQLLGRQQGLEDNDEIHMG